MILMPESDSILNSKLRCILQIMPELASQLETVYEREGRLDA